jgi:hypothetical protein
LTGGPGYLLSADTKQPCSGSDFPAWQWRYDRSKDGYGYYDSACNVWSSTLAAPSPYPSDKYEAVYLYGTSVTTSTVRVTLTFKHPVTNANILYLWNITVPSAFTDNATACLAPDCFLAHSGVRGLYHPPTYTKSRIVPFSGSINGLKVYAFALNLTTVIIDEALGIAASRAMLTNQVIAHLSGCNFVFYDMQGYGTRRLSMPIVPFTNSPFVLSAQVSEKPASFDACSIPPSRVLDLSKGMSVHNDRRMVVSGSRNYSTYSGIAGNAFGTPSGISQLLVDSESYVAISNISKPWSIFNPTSTIQQGRVPCSADLPGVRLHTTHFWFIRLILHV